jgi:hypothetical protein
LAIALSWLLWVVDRGGPVMGSLLDRDDRTLTAVSGPGYMRSF